MAKAIAVGAKPKEKKNLPGAFAMNWITVWGWWGNQPKTLDFLTDRGFTVRQFGDTIQTQWDAERPFLLDEIRLALIEYMEDI